MRRIVLSLLCAELLLHSTLHSQWIQTGGPSNGGSTNCFEVFGMNILAGTDSGVFRSTDAGASWAALDSNLACPRFSAFAALGTNLFTGNSFSLFQSVDSGTTWTGVSQPNYPVITLAAGGTTLFAGTYLAGVYRSGDSARSWIDLGPVANIFALAVVDSYLFAGSDAGIYRSKLDSTNWILADSGLGMAFTSSFASSGGNIFAGTDRGVFRSTDSGISWSAAASGLGNASVNALAAFGTYLFAGTNRGVFSSTNFGVSWNAVNEGLADTTVNSLVVTTPDSLRSGNLFAGTGSTGVWRRSVSDIIMSVQDASTNFPKQFFLAQNYPNPFNPATIIRYSLPFHTRVSMKIYTLLGQEVRTLVDEMEDPGDRWVEWDAVSMTSGVYFCRLKAGSYLKTMRLLLLR
jgi:photosystem II stability/assembly factor-like uncharacterized protein